MDAREAEALLEEAELIPCVHGFMAEIKRLVDRCLDADIAAMAGGLPDEAAPPAGGRDRGMGPKIYLLVREEDVPRVADLLRSEWADMVLREGTGATLLEAVSSGDAAAAVEGEGGGEGDLPCPACGTAAPLVDGACSDCGLQLE